MTVNDEAGSGEDDLVPNFAEAVQSQPNQQSHIALQC